MIRYSLRCSAGHAFDGWFRDSEAFENQARTAEQEDPALACPVCGSRSVEKQIMAPAVPTRKETPNSSTEVETPAMQSSAMQPLAMMGEQEREMRAMLRAFRQHLESSAENVGTKFADEARKIHYGETEERAIYGETSFDEAKALHEEGIEILPVPRVPDEMN